MDLSFSTLDLAITVGSVSLLNGSCAHICDSGTDSHTHCTSKSNQIFPFFFVGRKKKDLKRRLKIETELISNLVNLDTDLLSIVALLFIRSQLVVFISQPSSSSHG